MKSLVNLQENVGLSEFTTLKVGGKARYFYQAISEKEIILAANQALEENLDLFVLGGGSNVLISDKGFDGLVLQIKSNGVSFKKVNEKKILVTAQAGEDWDKFVELCVLKNLAGIECLSGIPGLVGGTPIQNVGAYGQEVSETIKSVRVFDRKFSKVADLKNSQCEFSYRKSIFNTRKKNRYIVLSVTFELIKFGQPKLVYKDLINKFNGFKPDLKSVREAVCEIRADKGMLVRQGGFDSQSAGSFFKNPIVSKEKFEKIKNKVKKLKLLQNNKNIPFYKTPDEKIKIPAAWLIEKSGFHKGFQIGNVGLSTKHTLALTNRGGASASDILDLKNKIQKKILEDFEIKLKPEPNFIGF